MIRFDSDNTKAKANHTKHGVSFEIARHVFDDPYALAEQDRINHGEVRWQTIGMVNGLVILLVAHTAESSNDSSEEFIRIISARRADRKELVMKKSVKKLLLA